VSVSVRAARPDDAGAIAGILNAIIATGSYTALDTPFSVEAERGFIERFPARGIFHVAERDGRVIGFQNVEPFATYTRAFDHVGVIGTYVDLDARRQGLATRLFAATSGAARGKGYRKFFSYIRADNPAALAAYDRLGFVVVGMARQHAKIGDRYVDEIVVEKLL
jgi:L-amino acid N-acyltransferase YncA